MDYKKEVIEPGDQISKLAHKINVDSYNNCPAVTVVPHWPGNFRGGVGMLPDPDVIKQMVAGNMLIEAENDGAGHKPQFFALLGEEEAFAQMAWEVVVMTIDDLARSGRFPVAFINDLQIKKITKENYHLAEAMLNGFGKVLKKAGLASITGETAIMKHSITSFFDHDKLMSDLLLTTWSGTAIGLSHKDALINGSEIKPDMLIVGFYEPGMRCNGASWMIDLIKKAFVPDNCPQSGILGALRSSPEAMAFIRLLTIPSLSYAKTVSRLIGWQPNGTLGTAMADIKGIAHITGGGLWSKLGELLPTGVGAKLPNMPEPCQVLKRAQKLSMGLEKTLYDEDAYEIFHGGCGMMLVVEDRASADIIIREAARDGISGRIVGRTNASDNISLQSKFRFSTPLSRRIR